MEKEKLYRDTETGMIYTETEIEKDFAYYYKYLENDPRTFKQYLNDCTGKNGFLELLKND